jgi:hypothetical protein
MLRPDYRSREYRRQKPTIIFQILTPSIAKVQSKKIVSKKVAKKSAPKPVKKAVKKSTKKVAKKTTTKKAATK